MKTVKKIISYACVAFTVIEFVLLITAQVMLSGSAKSDALVNFLGLRAAGAIFVTALIFSLAGLILNMKRVPSFLLRLIHFVVTLAVLEIAIVFVMSGFRAAALLVIGFAYTLLYILVTSLLYLIKRIRLSKREEKEDYVPLFNMEKK